MQVWYRMRSPGTPRPIVGWKGVVAGLLALGLTHFIAFPDGSSGKNDEVLADDSCGGSSGFQALPDTGFPFNPRTRGTNNRIKIDGLR